jgi:hypothetical protein
MNLLKQVTSWFRANLKGALTIVDLFGLGFSDRLSSARESRRLRFGSAMETNPRSISEIRRNSLMILTNKFHVSKPAMNTQAVGAHDLKHLHLT